MYACGGAVWSRWPRFVCYLLCAMFRVQVTLRVDGSGCESQSDSRTATVFACVSDACVLVDRDNYHISSYSLLVGRVVCVGDGGHVW